VISLRTQQRAEQAPCRRAAASRGRRRIALVLLPALALLPACDTDESTGGLSPSCITLIPAKVPPEGQDAIDGEVIAVWGADSTCDAIEVEFVISGIDHVWAASFEVVYPAGIAGLARIETEDSFLRGPEGADLLVNADEPVPGRAEIGVSRVDSQNNSGVAPSAGNTLLVRLIFFRFASSGQGFVTIEDANLTRVENPGDIPAPFDPPIEFSGGEFVIEN
jgi:hypothetical protein